MREMQLVVRSHPLVIVLQFHLNNDYAKYLHNALSLQSETCYTIYWCSMYLAFLAVSLYDSASDGALSTRPELLYSVDASPLSLDTQEQLPVALRLRKTFVSVAPVARARVCIVCYASEEELESLQTQIYAMDSPQLGLAVSFISIPRLPCLAFRSSDLRSVHVAETTKHA